MSGGRSNFNKRSSADALLKNDTKEGSPWKRQSLEKPVEIKHSPASVKPEHLDESGKLTVNAKSEKCHSIEIGTKSFNIYKMITNKLETGYDLDFDLAQDSVSGAWVVLKTYSLRKELPNIEKRIRTEVEILEAVKSLQGFAEKEEEGNKLFYVAMDYIDGEDYKKIYTTHKNLSLDKKIDIASRMVHELINLHQLGFIHTDIKLENYMGNLEKPYVKLMDFDTSLKMEDKDNGITTTTEIRGTFGLLPPEIMAALMASQPFTYSIKSDTYNLGITFNEWFTANTSNLSTNSIFNNSDPKLQQEVMEIVKEMKNEMPENRPDLMAVYNRLLALKSDQKLKNVPTLK